jgi:hypothetical protein
MCTDIVDGCTCTYVMVKVKRGLEKNLTEAAEKSIWRSLEEHNGGIEGSDDIVVRSATVEWSG